MFGFDNKVQDQPANDQPAAMGAPALPNEPPSSPPPSMMQTDPSRSFLNDNDKDADEGTSLLDAPSDNAAPSVMPSDSPAPSSAPSSAKPDDLLTIKQNALQQLSPLVGHLEQSPEEKFKTTMMMIQASDDQSLVPAAYEAANAIQDEKAKAQALLDIVNEINYFTQHHEN